MRTGTALRVAAVTLVLDLFAFPWSGEVWNGMGYEHGPKALQSSLWAWGGCLLAIIGAVISLSVRSRSSDPVKRGGWLRGAALSLGVLGFAFIVVQAVVESDRSFGLYSGVVAAGLVATLTVIDFRFPAGTGSIAPRAESIRDEANWEPTSTSTRVNATVGVVLAIGLFAIASAIGASMGGDAGHEDVDIAGDVVGLIVLTSVIVLAIWWDRIWHRD